MFDQLENIEKRYHEINSLLSKSEIVSDQNKFKKLSREHSQITKTVKLFEKYKKAKSDLDEAKELLLDSDEDMKDLAKSEIDTLESEIKSIEDALRVSLIPPDPNSGKGIIVEIRAGTGGDESALFAADLFRMYSRFAEIKKLKIDIMDSHETGLGGFKEITFSLDGKDAYDLFKFEMGGHRVQRVPETESSGRIHTSAATVAVLPQAEENELNIEEKDIRIDVFRASGPGGQSVNTTDSAVRITHIPTGIVVSCQDEKSQHKNKAKAMKVLRARIYEKMEQERQDELSQTRRSQVGSGDRSQRIRTYNFPENRVTDHRIQLTLYKLNSILEGNIDELIDALVKADNEKALKTFVQN